MKKQKTTSQLPLSLVFIGSLIAVFFIALILMIIIFRQFQEALLSSLSKQNEEFTAQVSATTRFADEILINTANQVFYDSAVSKLRGGENLNNEEFIKGVRQINAITASTTLIDSIYIYNAKQNYIFSTAQYGAVNDTVGHFKDQEAVKILRQASIKQRLVLIPRKAYTYSGYSDNYIYSFMMFDQQEPDNAILLNLRATAFTRLYFGNDFQNQAFIIDEDGGVIAAQDSLTDAQRSGWITKILEKKADGEDSGFLREKNQLCFFSSMGEHNWLYAKTLDYNEAFNGILTTRNRTLVFLTVIILLLTAVVILISKNVYLPLRKIAKRLSSGEKLEENPRRIMENLDLLIDEHDNREYLEPRIRHEILKDILLGKKSIKDPQFNMEACHLQIAIDFPVRLYLINDREPDPYADFIQGAIPYCEAAVIDNSFTILFLQPTQAGQEEAIREDFTNKYPKLLFIVSEEIDDWKRLPDVYLKLKETWLLRFLYPDARLMELRNQPEKSHSMASLSEKSAATLGYLKKGLFSTATEKFNSFLEDLSQKNYSTSRIALINLGNAVLKLASDYHVLDCSYEQSCTNYQRTIDGLEDLQTLKNLFEKIFQKITTHVQEAQQNMRSSTIEDIDNYLKENYTDSSLSTKSIADCFMMSPAYLSRIYRKSKGCSLMHTLNLIRMQKAKEYLCDAQFLIKDIPQRLGIDNSQYFFQLFKSLVGKTPKEYQRDQMLLKKTSKQKQNKQP